MKDQSKSQSGKPADKGKVKDLPAKGPTRDKERQVKGGGGKVGIDPGKPSAARSKPTSF